MASADATKKVEMLINIQFNGAKSSIKAFVNDMNAFKTSVQNIVNDIQNISKKMDGLSGSFEKSMNKVFFGSMKKIPKGGVFGGLKTQFSDFGKDINTSMAAAVKDIKNSKVTDLLAKEFVKLQSKTQDSISKQMNKPTTGSKTLVNRSQAEKLIATMLGAGENMFGNIDLRNITPEFLMKNTSVKKFQNKLFELKKKVAIGKFETLSDPNVSNMLPQKEKTKKLSRAQAEKLITSYLGAGLGEWGGMELMNVSPEFLMKNTSVKKFQNAMLELKKKLIVDSAAKSGKGNFEKELSSKTKLEGLQNKEYLRDLKEQSNIKIKETKDFNAAQKLQESVNKQNYNARLDAIKSAFVSDDKQKFNQAQIKFDNITTERKYYEQIQKAKVQKDKSLQQYKQQYFKSVGTKAKIVPFNVTEDDFVGLANLDFFAKEANQIKSKPKMSKEEIDYLSGNSSYKEIKKQRKEVAIGMANLNKLAYKAEDKLGPIGVIDPKKALKEQRIGWQNYEKLSAMAESKLGEIGAKPPFPPSPPTASFEEFKKSLLDLREALVGTFQIKPLMDSFMDLFSTVYNHIKTIVTGMIVTLTGLTAAFMGVGFAIKSWATDVLLTTEKMRGYNIALLGMLKTQSNVDKLMKTSFEVTEKLPVAYEQVFQASKAMSLISPLRPLLQDSTTMKSTMEDVWKILIGLQQIEPEWGIQGAMFSLREALSGDLLSLKRRFELPVDVYMTDKGEKLTDVKFDRKKVIEVLSKEMQSLVPPEALAMAAKQFGVVISRMEGIYTQFKSKIGESGFYDVVVDDIRRAYDYLNEFVNSKNFEKIALRISNALSEGFVQFKQFVVNTAGAIKTVFNIDIGGFLGSLDGATSVLETYVSTFKGFVNLIGDSRFQNFIKYYWDEVKNTISKVITVVKNLFVDLKSDFDTVYGYLSKFKTNTEGMFSSRGVNKGIFYAWFFGPMNIVNVLLSVSNSLLAISNTLAIIKGMKIVESFGGFKGLSLILTGTVSKIIFITASIYALKEAFDILSSVRLPTWFRTMFGIEDDIDKFEKFKIAMGVLNAEFYQFNKVSDEMDLGINFKELTESDFLNTKKIKEYRDNIKLLQEDLKNIVNIRINAIKNPSESPYLKTRKVSIDYKQEIKKLEYLKTVINSYTDKFGLLTESSKGFDFKTVAKSYIDIGDEADKGEKKQRGFWDTISSGIRKGIDAMLGLEEIMLDLTNIFNNFNEISSKGINNYFKSSSVNLGKMLDEDKKKLTFVLAAMQEITGVKPTITDVYDSTGKGHTTGSKHYDEITKVADIRNDLKKEQVNTESFAMKLSQMKQFGVSKILLESPNKFFDKKIFDKIDKQMLQVTNGGDAPHFHFEFFDDISKNIKKELVTAVESSGLEGAGADAFSNTAIGDRGNNLERLFVELTTELNNVNIANENFIKQSNTLTNQITTTFQNSIDELKSNQSLSLGNKFNTALDLQLNNIIQTVDNANANISQKVIDLSQEFLNVVTMHNFGEFSDDSTNAIKQWVGFFNDFYYGSINEEIKKTAKSKAVTDKEHNKLYTEYVYGEQLTDEKLKLLNTTKINAIYNGDVLKDYKKELLDVQSLMFNFENPTAPDEVSSMFKGLKDDVLVYNMSLDDAIDKQLKLVMTSIIKENDNDKRTALIAFYEKLFNTKEIYAANSAYQAFNKTQTSFVNIMNDLDFTKMNQLKDYLKTNMQYMNRATRTTGFSQYEKNLEMSPDSDAFRMGMSSALSEWKTWSEQMYDTGKTMVGDLTSTFETGFFDVLSGKLAGIRNTFQQLGASVRDMILKIIAKMLALSAVKIVLGVDINGNVGSGGIGGLLGGLGGNTGGIGGMFGNIGSMLWGKKTTSQTANQFGQGGDILKIAMGAGGGMGGGGGNLLSTILGASMGAKTTTSGWGPLNLLGKGGLGNSLYKTLGGAAGVGLLGAGMFLSQPGRLMGGTKDKTGEAKTQYETASQSRDTMVKRRPEDVEKYMMSSWTDTISKFQFGGIGYSEWSSGDGWFKGPKEKHAGTDTSTFDKSMNAYYGLLNIAAQSHYKNVLDIDKLRSKNEIAATQKEKGLKEEYYKIIKSEYETALATSNFETADKVRDKYYELGNELSQTADDLINMIKENKYKKNEYEAFLVSYGSGDESKYQQELINSNKQRLLELVEGTNEWYDLKMDILNSEKELTNNIKTKIEEYQSQLNTSLSGIYSMKNLMITNPLTNYLKIIGNSIPISYGLSNTNIPIGFNNLNVPSKESDKYINQINKYYDELKSIENGNVSKYKTISGYSWNDIQGKSYLQQTDNGTRSVSFNQGMNITNTQSNKIKSGDKNVLKELLDEASLQIIYSSISGEKGNSKIGEKELDTIFSNIIGTKVDITETYTSNIEEVKKKIGKNIERLLLSAKIEETTIENTKRMTNIYINDNEKFWNGLKETSEYLVSLNNALLLTSDVDRLGQIKEIIANVNSEYISGFENLAGQITGWFDSGLLTSKMQLSLYTPFDELKKKFEEIALNVRKTNFKSGILETVKGFESGQQFTDIYKEMINMPGVLANYKTTVSSKKMNMKDSSAKEAITTILSDTMAGEQYKKLDTLINANKDDPYMTWYQWSLDIVKNKIKNATEGSDIYFSAQEELFNLLADKSEHLKQKAQNSMDKLEEMLGKIEETVKMRIAEERKTAKGDAFFIDLGGTRMNDKALNELLSKINTNDPKAKEVVDAFKKRILGISR